MKLLTKLPNRKFYKLNEKRNSWYVFCDVSSPKIKLLSKVAYPWDDEILLIPEVVRAKSDNSSYNLSLNLKIFPNEFPNERDKNIKTVKLNREIKKGHFPYSNPCQMFAAIPLQELSGPILWLVYSA